MITIDVIERIVSGKIHTVQPEDKHLSKIINISKMSSSRGWIGQKFVLDHLKPLSSIEIG